MPQDWNMSHREAEIYFSSKNTAKMLTRHLQVLWSSFSCLTKVRKAASLLKCISERDDTSRVAMHKEIAFEAGEGSIFFSSKSVEFPIDLSGSRIWP